MIKHNKRKRHMKVLEVKPMKAPYVKEIEHTLENLQEAVEGPIQMLYPFDDHVCIICNDEGKIANLPLNRALRHETGEIYDIIAGTFLITGMGEDDITDLTEELKDKYRKVFLYPEMFIRTGDTITAIQIRN